MKVAVKDTKTGEAFILNAMAASDMIGVCPSDLYRMANRDVEEYRHFKLFYNVEIIPNKPRGKPYVKGKSGYIDALFSKVKRK